MLLIIKLLFILSDDHQNAIHYLKKIIENKDLKMREDLLCFARVLSLFSHYEAGYDYDLDKHIRDTYKFLLKMDDLHEVQKSMIVFIRRLGDIFPHELKKHFKALHIELKQYEDDPYERRIFIFGYFIVVGKSYREPIEQIIQRSTNTIGITGRP